MTKCSHTIHTSTKARDDAGF